MTFASGLHGRVSDLPADVSAAIHHRQARIPFHRIRTRSDWYALNGIEQQAVDRLAKQHHLTEDERQLLLRHHLDFFDRNASNAAPSVAATIYPHGREGAAFIGYRTVRRHRHPRRRVIPVGWGTWFGNRWVTIRQAWFRVRVRY